MGFHSIPAVGNGATKEFTVYLSEADCTDYVDSFARINAASEDAEFKKFIIPHDFTALVEAVVDWFSGATATMRFDILGQYGGIGEGPYTHNESDNDVDVVCVINKYNEIDISGVLTSLTAGDIVFIKVTADATVNIPNGWVASLRIKYT